MLRVLQIVSAPHPGPDGRAGVTGPERRIAALAPLFPALGVEPVILYPRRGRLWDQFAATGLTLIDGEPGGKLNLKAPGMIARLAREHGAGLIHTQGPGSYDAQACVAGRMAGIPVVVTRPVMIEDLTDRSALRTKIYALIDRLVVPNLAARVVAVGQNGYERLRDVTGVPLSKLRLVRNGAPLEGYSARFHGASSGRADEPPVVIGMVGHLLPYKGYDDFLKTIAALRRRGLNVVARIAGEGSERAHLEDLAHDLGVAEAVAFLGYRSDMAPVLSEFDIFLFTSLREGLAMAVVEAMASGLPIVASEIGGIREQVEDGVNGHVLRAGDVEGFAARTAELVVDPARRAAYGAASRALALDRFDQQRMLREYAALYHDVAGTTP